MMILTTTLTGRVLLWRSQHRLFFSATTTTTTTTSVRKKCAQNKLIPNQAYHNEDFFHKFNRFTPQSVLLLPLM